MISSVTSDSPAARAGLSEQDEIVAVDGARMNADRLAETLKAHSPGDQLRVLFSRRNKIQEATVTLAHQTDYSFRIQPAPNPDPLQSAILEGWLKPQTPR